MNVRHLPAAVQTALRVEAMTTLRRMERLLGDRRPSHAATVLALAALFANRAAQAGIPGSVEDALVTALRTLVEDAMAPTAADQLRAAALSATDDELPPNTSDVLLGLRAEAVNEATPIHEEPR